MRSRGLSELSCASSGCRKNPETIYSHWGKFITYQRVNTQAVDTSIGSRFNATMQSSLRLTWSAILLVGLLGFNLIVTRRSYANYNYDNSNRTLDESIHLLSVGAGISSPSLTSSLGQNPAGLFFIQQTKLLGAIGFTNSNFNPVGFGGLVFLGNGSVGGGLGIQTFNGVGNNAGSIVLLDFGLAAEIPSLNLSIGATGSYLSGSSGTVLAPGGAYGPLGLDLGILYNPRGDVHFGLTTFQVQAGIEAIAAGLSAEATQWATFAVDGAIDPKGWGGTTLKPAMGIHLSDFQISFGYGFALDNAAIPNWIRRGGSLAVGFKINWQVHVQAYYNELALYYFGLTVNL